MPLNSLEPKVQGRIMRALRLIWSQTFRAKALQTAAVYYYPEKKDGTPSKRKKIMGYRCSACSHQFDRKQVQIDHKVSVHTGTTFAERLDLLFCPLEGLQVMCKQCHQGKTNRERK